MKKCPQIGVNEFWRDMLTAIVFFLVLTESLAYALIAFAEAGTISPAERVVALAMFRLVLLAGSAGMVTMCVSTILNKERLWSYVAGFSLTLLGMTALIPPFFFNGGALCLIFYVFVLGFGPAVGFVICSTKLDSSKVEVKLETVADIDEAGIFQ